MRCVCVKLPEHLAELVDGLVEKGVYSSRSDAIRDAVRRLAISYTGWSEIRSRRRRDAKVIRV